MRASVLLTIGSRDVGRMTSRPAGTFCPAYQLDPFGTGAQR
jgi:hypothetical protein